MELTVVSLLMALLAMLLSSAWVGVGRTTADLIGRSRLVQERDSAMAALSRDLGGCRVVGSTARTGEKIDTRWLTWEILNNTLLPSNQDLKLTYDGGTDSGGNILPKTEVRYMVVADPDPAVSTLIPVPLILVRRETVNVEIPTVFTDFTVAKNVYGMSVTPDLIPDPNEVNIVLRFKYRKLTLTCDLTAKRPSSLSNNTLHYINP